MRYINPKTNVQDFELLNSLCGNSPKETLPTVPVVNEEGWEGE